MKNNKNIINFTFIETFKGVNASILNNIKGNDEGEKYEKNSSYVINLTLTFRVNGIHVVRGSTKRHPLNIISCVPKCYISYIYIGNKREREGE